MQHNKCSRGLKKRGKTQLLFFNSNYFPVFIIATVRARVVRLLGLFTLGAEAHDRLVKLVVGSSFSSS
jgi:hypothetical protein